MKNYTIEKSEKYLLLKLGEILTYNDCKDFEPDLDMLINKQDQHVLVDCQVLETLSKDWIRALLRLQMGLKKKKLQLRLINVTPTVLTFLKREGIDTAFTINNQLKDAIEELGLIQKKTFDTGFINPFLDATLRVLEVQASVEARPGKIALKKSDKDFPADISGIIGIVSDNFKGSVVISFPEKTFLKVISKMLGEEYTSITKDIIDGASEITNMIFGQAKIVLNEKGYGIKTALPSVVHGKNHILSSQTSGPIVVIPFESDVGNFHVEICLSA